MLKTYGSPSMRHFHKVMFATVVHQAAFSLGYTEDLRRGIGVDLRRTGVQSTRCRRIEASEKGNIWRNWCTFTTRQRAISPVVAVANK